MANLVLKITRDEKKAVEANYVYKDIDVFSDKYAVNKVDMLTDVEAVKAAVRNIFTWNVGEEILYPQFGNNLRKFLYKPLDETERRVFRRPRRQAAVSPRGGASARDESSESRRDI